MQTVWQKLTCRVVAALIITLVSSNCPSWAYPIDGFAETGIRRLKQLELIAAGKLPGALAAPGAKKPLMEIKLQLLDAAGSLEALAARTPDLQARLDDLFPGRHESYALMLVDISPGRHPRMAERQADRGFSPGRVGKLAIAAGLFAKLKRLYPDDISKRIDLLKSRMIEAENWIRTDSHTVPFFNPRTGEFQSRRLKEGDLFSLYEWTDHMLSASANAAASTVWKELLLMRYFKNEYPVNRETEAWFFQQTPLKQLTELALAVVNDPLRAIGISETEWHLGSFFTATGKRRVPPAGGSIATPRGMMRFLVNMEKGQLVDKWSSLEIKRLMFMSARRIRYASAPALAGAAVYYKSGSLFRCKPEQGFKCEKYKGNVENVMNSVAIVEQPDGRIYYVTLMSNILRKNSAVEHQTLATQIDRLLLK